MKVPEVYAQSFRSSAKLKLRAKALFAGGTDEEVFAACVLLHEAARTERRAVNALSLCPPQTRLLAYIEECWCLVEGRDPAEAAQVWGQILRERDQVGSDTFDVMVARLQPRFHSQQTEFGKAVTSSPGIMRIRAAGSFSGIPTNERQRYRKEVCAVLAKFPGLASFHWMDYRLAEQDDGRAAWDALSRARALQPDNRRFEAMSLLVAASSLPVGEAEKHLASVRSGLDSAGAEICLMYAMAELQLARRTKKVANRTQRWQQARQAVLAGLSQASSVGLRQNLLAAELLSSTLLRNKKPTTELLYVAGLVDITMRELENPDVVDLLTRSASEAVQLAA